VQVVKDDDDDDENKQATRAAGERQLLGQIACSLLTATTTQQPRPTTFPRNHFCDLRSGGPAAILSHFIDSRLIRWLLMCLRKNRRGGRGCCFPGT